MDQEEQALIKEAQRGNVWAFESLIKKYDKRVTQLAYSLVNNSSDAEDIYQEVFIRVYKNLYRFRFKSEFWTWLCRIVVNYCINFRKKKSRTKFYSVDVEKEDSNENWKVSLKDENNDPEDIVLNKELSNQIEMALDRLSSQQKTVFILRHYQGHKLKEIAKILNCTEGTIKNHLFRATQKMQILLKDYAKI